MTPRSQTDGTGTTYVLPDEWTVGEAVEFVRRTRVEAEASGHANVALREAAAEAVPILMAQQHAGTRVIGRAIIAALGADPRPERA